MIGPDALHRTDTDFYQAHQHLARITRGTNPFNIKFFLDAHFALHTRAVATSFLAAKGIVARLGGERVKAAKRQAKGLAWP